MANLRIAQITDTHVTSEGKLIRGIDTRLNFLKTIEVLKQLPFDLLVISGDLAAIRGGLEIYEWMNAQITNLPFPTLIIAGNHDKVPEMKSVFQESGIFPGEKAYFIHQAQGRHLIFLDTSSNELPTHQLEWLRQQCESIQEEVFVFMHHPPSYCHCVFMDRKYPLRNIQEAEVYFKAIPNISHLFCGHYHTEKTVYKDGKTIHLTPSTMLQLRQDREDYCVESVTPAWREIEWQDSTMMTCVHYLEEKRL